MPPINANLEFLSRLELYETEKPYAILLGENETIDEDVPITNLAFSVVPQVPVRDMRCDTTLDFESCGFEYLAHNASKVKSFSHQSDVHTYRAETSDLLRQRFAAVAVVTYEVKLRQNIVFDRDSYDINDSLVVEGPAKGAHVDVTGSSVHRIVEKHLSEKEQQMYLSSNYRLRIVNTWRPLNAVLEDRPLALCHASSIAKGDLAAADRVLPDTVGEMYYLHHSDQQKWYWLERQKTTEPFIFLMFDTQAKDSQTYAVCPHVSFHNNRASENAAPRSSVETRSIVITKSTI